MTSDPPTECCDHDDCATYICEACRCTLQDVEVAITQFRAALSAYVDRVRHGEDVILTDRGLPVARLVAVDASPLLEQLEREGVITAATAARPRATGRGRVTANRPVGDLVPELRH